MENTSAILTSEVVTIRWTHAEQQEDIALSGFTIVGGPISLINTPPTINQSVAAGVFEVTLSLSTLDPETDYRVTIKAMNLLGESEGTEVTFRTLRSEFCKGLNRGVGREEGKKTNPILLQHLVHPHN